MDFKAFIEIIRPINSLMMGLAVIVGTIIACNSLELMLHNMIGVIWGFLTAFALTAASMVINDVLDVNVDRVNAPWRPIPSGRISLTTAKAYFLALCIIGLLASYFINSLALLVAFISIIISYTYSAWGKRTGLLGNAMVSLCVAIPFIYGSIIIYNSIIPITLIFFTIAFLANMGREVTKGMVDVEPLAEAIRNKCAKYGVDVRDLIIYADPSDPDKIEALRRLGFWVKKAKKDVLAGIYAVKRFRVVVNPDCVGVRREMGGYVWQKDRSGQIVEVPVKMNDDGMDAIRYAVYSSEKSRSRNNIRGAYVV